MKLIKSNIYLSVQFLFILTIFHACVPVNKTILLQSEEKSILQYEYPNEASTYKLKQGDNLYVGIENVDPENMLSFFESDYQEAGLDSDIGVYIKNYTVDDSGFITIPVVGKIYVQNSSLNQAKDSIQVKVDELYKNSLITVRLVNFNVSVMGEVKNPGTYQVYNDRMNLLQAISLAGDFSSYASRKNVKILRKNSGGDIDILQINLLKDKAIESPAYMLHPNDIIIIEPMSNKNFAFDAFPYEILLATVSTVLVIFSFL